MPLRDVAEKAGVSISTVSKVLNDRRGTPGGAVANTSRRNWSSTKATVPRRRAACLERGVSRNHYLPDVVLAAVLAVSKQKLPGG